MRADPGAEGVAAKTTCHPLPPFRSPAQAQRTCRTISLRRHCPGQVLEVAIWLPRSPRRQNLSLRSGCPERIREAITATEPDEAGRHEHPQLPEPGRDAFEQDDFLVAAGTDGLDQPPALA